MAQLCDVNTHLCCLHWPSVFITTCHLIATLDGLQKYLFVQILWWAKLSPPDCLQASQNDRHELFKAESATNYSGSKFIKNNKAPGHQLHTKSSGQIWRPSMDEFYKVHPSLIQNQRFPFHKVIYGWVLLAVISVVILSALSLLKEFVIGPVSTSQANFF